jgi:hypothetical protein
MTDLLNPTWDQTTERYFDLSGTQRLGLLPTRGEKRLVPIEIDMGAIPNNSSEEYEAITMAQQTLTDYVTLRIPFRKNSSNPDDNYFYYRFLINPKTVSVARQTLDAHSMTRAGWQFGIWGEDTVDIHLSGTTAGRYFSSGLSEEFAEYSLSYRNVLELENVFENNGYFFEGEETNKTVFAADFTRKRIKCHADVQLMVGNFIWYGMCTGMTLNFSSDTPFFNTFDLGFLSWKERFRRESPWLSSIRNDVYRGHSKELIVGREKSKDTQDLGAQTSATTLPSFSDLYSGSDVKTSLSALTDMVPLGIPSSYNPVVSNLVVEDLKKKVFG